MTQFLLKNCNYAIFSNIPRKYWDPTLNPFCQKNMTTTNPEFLWLKHLPIGIPLRLLKKNNKNKSSEPSIVEKQIIQFCGWICQSLRNHSLFPEMIPIPAKWFVFNGLHQGVTKRANRERVWWAFSYELSENSLMFTLKLSSCYGLVQTKS